MPSYGLGCPMGFFGLSHGVVVGNAERNPYNCSMNGLLTWGDNYCRKLVIIGDGACGKTSLLSVFTLGYFPTVSVLKQSNPYVSAANNG